MLPTLAAFLVTGLYLRRKGSEHGALETGGTTLPLEHITSGDVKAMFPGKHMLYPFAYDEDARLDAGLPNYRIQQGNPSRINAPNFWMTDPNEKQSHVINKNNELWMKAAGRTDGEKLFSLRNNKALLIDKWNNDDWGWGVMGKFMSPVYLQTRGSTVNGPPKINDAFLC